MRTKHDGDCSIYASLDNYGVPEAGICTCGYGHQELGKTGDLSKLYSEELMKKLENENPHPISKSDLIKMMKEGGWTIKNGN